MRSLLAVALVLLLGTVSRSASAAEEKSESAKPSAPGVTAQVFHEHTNRVFQVRIIEKTSGEKAGIGSGFSVDGAGTIVTNFHVVSEVAHYPEKYRIDILGSDGTVVAAELLRFDVVHDLALLRSKIITPNHFEPHAFAPLGAITKGQRLFSIGNPHDLGFTIVEGIFNGPVENSLYEKIHFTGSINPGMSGGPCLTERGELVGVNVATSGNQVSFLVPSSYVAKLIEGGENPEPTKQVSKKEWGDEIRKQLLENQDTIVKRLSEHPFETVPMGRFTVPTKPNPAFRCWSTTDEQPQLRYTALSHYCSTRDRLFISGDLFSGLLQIRHSHFEAKGLNRFQTYDALQSWFNNYDSPTQVEENDLTNYECKRGFVTERAAELRVVYCLRAYKKFRGLYDVVVLGATLNEPASGLVTEFTAMGVSLTNAQKLAKRFLEGFSWTGRSS